MKRTSKAAVYAAYGIRYRPQNHGQIKTPDGHWIPVLMINGNTKIGRGVWTFSTLPGTAIYHAIVNGQAVDVRGTCPCDCIGCYAKTGRYKLPSNVNALALRTIIARDYTDWMRRAITAQIIADDIRTVRVHASGDFFNDAYIDAWKAIAAAAPNVRFWTYTKNASAVAAFDSVPNLNIVRSIVPEIGLNYGTCAHVLNTYAALTARGEAVHICPCGTDPNQHCNNCTGCSKYRYVLFVEHSTAYNAAADPLFPDVCRAVAMQQD